MVCLCKEVVVTSEKLSCHVVTKLKKKKRIIMFQRYSVLHEETFPHGYKRCKPTQLGLTMSVTKVSMATAVYLSGFNLTTKDMS